MITYAVKKTRNPKYPGTDYYAGRAIKTGEYTFEDLAEDINNSTTVTKADAMAVLASVKPYITRALLNGQVVALQDIGRFQVTLQGKCYPAEVLSNKEFKPSEMIRGHKIVFRPEGKLKKAIADGFQLKRVSSEALA